MRIKAVIVHGGQALLEAGLVAIVVAVLVGGTVLAAKPAGSGGGKGGGTSVAVVMVADADGNSAPNWGETVTFRVTTSNPYPVASVRCSQNGNVVYGDSHPMYLPNIWDDPGHFVLSSMAWSGGAASCVAEIKATSSSGRIVVLASTTFAAGA